MRVTIHLPDPVRKSIKRHIETAVKKAVAAHQSGQEEEDTLTGHLGSSLRTPHPRRVPVNGQTWTWAITYYKFRSKGRNATEKIIGADGLFELSINDVEQRRSKAALFQAKVGKGDGKRLLKQAISLTTWKEAAFIIRYDPEKYSAVTLDNVIRQAAGFGPAAEVLLDVFLMEYFVDCLIGDSELHYEPSERILRWKDAHGDVVHASFSVKHAIKLQIDGPRQQSYYRGNKIESVEVHEHRMEATDEEILGVAGSATEREVKRARKEAAKIYHADKHQQLDEGTLDILTSQLKEINAATDRILARTARHKRE